MALTDETRRRLAACSSATLSTQLFKRGLRNQVLQGVLRLTPKAPTMVGEAYTLRNIPAREDIDHIGVYDNPEHPQRKAIEVAPPGSVLVIDCRGDARVASGGQILATRLLVRGAAGIVSDGGMRDAAPISRMPMPVFCAGPSAPLNLVHHHAVDIDVPIACGGVAVYPGDLIVGDMDGVVVIPAALAEEIAAEAAEQEHMESFLLARIAAGARLPGTYPPDDATKAAYQAWRKTNPPT